MDVSLPYQYAILSMSVVQNFHCKLNSSNPIVHYTVYNKSVYLPFDVFCSVMRVPNRGSVEKPKCNPRLLMYVYEEICYVRSFSKEDGKIRSIHLPSIRYFAYFISKCVLARRSAGKLGLPDLAFLAAALCRDRTYNLGALIAHHFVANHKKGGVCGGLVASRLLASHCLYPHPQDLLLSMEKLDTESMKRHEFIARSGSLHYLPYTITYSKRKHLKVTTIARSVILPAPIFNLVGRGTISVAEAELDTLG